MVGYIVDEIDIIPLAIGEIKMYQVFLKMN